jgi:hypothetical protein
MGQVKKRAGIFVIAAVVIIVSASCGINASESVYYDGFNIQDINGKEVLFISTISISSSAYKYLVVVIPDKEKEGTATNMLIYEAQRDKSLKQIYQEKHQSPFRPYFIRCFTKGFLVAHLGGGRHQKYSFYKVKDSIVSKVFDGECDTLEIACYEGFDEMPHLFCSERDPAKKSKGIHSNYLFTDIYLWSKSKQKYVQLKRQYYNKNNPFTSRFDLYKNNEPMFGL